MRTRQFLCDETLESLRADLRAAGWNVGPIVGRGIGACFVADCPATGNVLDATLCAASTSLRRPGRRRHALRNSARAPSQRATCAAAACGCRSSSCGAS